MLFPIFTFRPSSELHGHLKADTRRGVVEFDPANQARNRLEGQGRFDVRASGRSAYNCQEDTL